MKWAIAFIFMLSIGANAAPKYVPLTNTDNRVLQEPTFKQPVYNVVVTGVSNTTTGAISGSLYDVINASKAFTSNDPGFTRNVFSATNFAVVTITAAASGTGVQTLITPPAGYKVRVLGWHAYATNNSTLSGGGILNVNLLEGTSALIDRGIIYLGNNAATASGGAMLIDDDNQAFWGAGYVAATNAVISYSFSSAITAGAILIHVAYSLEQ